MEDVFMFIPNKFVMNGREWKQSLIPHTESVLPYKFTYS